MVLFTALRPTWFGSIRSSVSPVFCLAAFSASGLILKFCIPWTKAGKTRSPYRSSLNLRRVGGAVLWNLWIHCVNYQWQRHFQISTVMLCVTLLPFLWFYLILAAGLWVDLIITNLLCVHPYVEARGQPWVLHLRNCPPCVLRQSLPLAWNLSSRQADWLVNLRMHLAPSLLWWD